MRRFWLGLLVAACGGGDFDAGAGVEPPDGAVAPVSVADEQDAGRDAKRSEGPDVRRDGGATPEPREDAVAPVAQVDSAPPVDDSGPLVVDAGPPDVEPPPLVCGSGEKVCAGVCEANGARDRSLQTRL